MMTTQIGGKYHPADDSVFRVKKVITQLGLKVTHPIADEIKANTEHHALAFDPNEHVFSEVERHYYESIRICDFHTVCNRFKDDIGYLGVSASLELAFAICHRRPIVLLHPANITKAVDPFIHDFLRRNLRQVTVHNFLSSDRPTNLAAIASAAHRYIDYGVTANEQQVVHKRVDSLINGLKVEYAAT